MAKFNDLGLGNKVKRIVNRDGSFNVKRVGLGWSTVNLYRDLIKISWVKFILLTFGFLILINIGFASIYYLIGIDQLIGITPSTPLRDFINCVYFSFQTFTTVGYGNIYPNSDWTNIMASLEPIVGWMMFALTTGLLYARFSRPSAKILFSDNLLIAPYEKGESLQFRIVNKRRSAIMNMNARVVFSYLVKGKYRKYQVLDLERTNVTVFPLNWTIVHPITENSPLFKKDRNALSDVDSEFIILLHGYDETFSQEIHAMHSYHYNEIIWNAQFTPMYDTGTDPIILDISKLNDFEREESIS